jgi:MYXO-CTERM domain-containing protein
VWLAPEQRDEPEPTPAVPALDDASEEGEPMPVARYGCAAAGGAPRPGLQAGLIVLFVVLLWRRRKDGYA